MPKTSGSFKPGRSGNPSGRSSAHRQLARYIREKTKDGQELADICLKIVRNSKNEPRVRMLAIEWLGDRGIGKPVIPIDLNVGSEINLETLDLTKLSTEELDDLIAKAEAEAAQEESDAADASAGGGSSPQG